MNFPETEGWYFPKVKLEIVLIKPNILYDINDINNKNLSKKDNVKGISNESSEN